MIFSVFRICRALAVSLCCWVFAERLAGATNEPQPEVRVILWFDTEDYLLPADDDATKRLCEMLTDRGIRATFKLVGEKARALEQRGRRDVLAALRKHAIGYHSDFHSVHPTPTEYLADCDWLEGVGEFARHERQGAADVRRILGVTTLACYGQPGSSWAPQAIAALRQIGVAPHDVPCYVDEGAQVGLNEQPFWYAGALHVYHMGANLTRMELHDEAAIAPAKTAVSEIADRLRRQGGGLISIFYHPGEWVHREFWDAVNFRRGANPPREQWRAPPQRPPEETEAAFRRFGQYVDYICGIPGARWVSASDLPLLYPDLTQTEGATAEDLKELARRIAEDGSTGLDALRLGPRAYSVADQFELLTLAVDELIAGRKPGFPLKTSGLLGPVASPPPAAGLSQLSWLAFRDAARDVSGFIRTQRRIPARVFVGPEAVAPADFLVALARVYSACRTRVGLPVSEEFPLGRNTPVLAARHVAAETPDLFGGWIIHKEGLRAPKLMELARLQAWTLKPALPAP